MLFKNFIYAGLLLIISLSLCSASVPHSSEELAAFDYIIKSKPHLLSYYRAKADVPSHQSHPDETLLLSKHGEATLRKLVDQHTTIKGNLARSSHPYRTSLLQLIKHDIQLFDNTYFPCFFSQVKGLQVLLEANFHTELTLLSTVKSTFKYNHNREAGVLWHSYEAAKSFPHAMASIIASISTRTPSFMPDITSKLASQSEEYAKDLKILERLERATLTVENNRLIIKSVLEKKDALLKTQISEQSIFEVAQMQLFLEWMGEHYPNVDIFPGMTVLPDNINLLNVPSIPILEGYWDGIGIEVSPKLQKAYKGWKSAQVNNYLQETTFLPKEMIDELASNEARCRRLSFLCE